LRALKNHIRPGEPDLYAWRKRQNWHTVGAKNGNPLGELSRHSGIEA